MLDLLVGGMGGERGHYIAFCSIRESLFSALLGDIPRRLERGLRTRNE
jgi:hypothetical protein